MNSTKNINSHLPLRCCSILNNTIGVLVGRVWSVCSRFLSELIRRISLITCPKFSKKLEHTSSNNKDVVLTEKNTQVLSNTALPISIPSTSLIEEKKEKELPFIEIDLQKLLTEPPLSTAPLATINSHLNSGTPLFNSSDSLASPKKINENVDSPSDFQTNNHQSAPQTTFQEKLKLVHNTSTTPQNNFPGFIRSKRFSFANQTHFKTSEQKTFSSSPAKIQNIQSNDSISKQPILIETGGKGDCLLSSFLKGLQMQHPDLLKDQKNGNGTLLTAQKLREIGVEFASEQLEKNGVWFNEISGYLEADWKEYKDTEVDAVQKPWVLEKQKIEENFKTKKILKRRYEIEMKKLKEKYLPLVDRLEKNLCKSNEEFLLKLKDSGFCCSTLHLFALSAFFEIPLIVHHQNGVKGHDTETFNPTNSKKEPIHLHYSRMHFKYLFFPT